MSNRPEVRQEFFSVRECARCLPWLTERQVRCMYERGEIGQKFGGSVRIHQSELDRLIAARRVPATSRGIDDRLVRDQITRWSLVCRTNDPVALVRYLATWRVDFRHGFPELSGLYERGQLGRPV
jgi:hypothetical protein